MTAGLRAIGENCVSTINGWTSPSSVAGPTGWRLPSPVLAPGCPCRSWKLSRPSVVQFTVPDISYANPLEGRPAAIAYRDLDRTCAELEHGASWRRLLGPLVRDPGGVIDVMLGDKRSVPAIRPAVRLGIRVLAQATPAWRLLAGDDARALFAGVAAHAVRPMPSLTAAGLGMLLAPLAHTAGWPIPAGGTGAITDALIADLRAHGGRLTAGVEVTEPPAGVVVFDTAPTALLRIYRDTLPSRYAKALRRYRYGSGIAKVDFVLSGEVPWADPRLKQAATLHLGGGREQMARAEADVAAGRHAVRPMVLASLPHLADPARIDAVGRRPMWTYAHVPAGSPLDATEAVTTAIDQFAPGFRDLVVAARSVPAAQLADHNANYVGGDISVGTSAWRALVGPTPRLNPWTTPLPGVYLCSGATPPAPGVHGMCGYYAARTVLKREFGIHQLPSLAP